MGPSQTLVIRTSYHKLNILGSMGLHAVTHHDADHFRVFDTDLITSAAVAQRGRDRVDRQFDAFLDPGIILAGAIALEQFDLQQVQRLDVGKP